MAAFGLPNYNASGDLIQRRANALLLNPSTADADYAAAGLNLASGIPGSNFGANRQLILRDSEQQARLMDAARILEPYQQRASSENIAAQAQAGEDRRLAVSGQQAMERLQAEQSGAMERLTAQQRGELERQALEGNQAASRLATQEAGETSRLGIVQGGETSRQQAQIEAQRAAQAISEAGLASRLSAEAANALQLAILRGDQATAQQLLEQAGATTLQRERLAASLRETQIQGQNQLRNTLVSGLLANAGREGSVRGGSAPTTSTYFQELLPPPSIGQPTVGSVRPGTTTSSGPSRAISSIDRILSHYGLSGSTTNLGQYF